MTNYYDRDSDTSKECSRYFWKKGKDEDSNFGSGWYECYLINYNYNLGFKLPGEFKHKNSEIAVGIHECHNGNVYSEWGKDGNTGKFI